jgi:predicted dehydrogenase
MSSNFVGVVGLGSAGLRHSRLLADRGFQVVAVRSRSGPTVHKSPTRTIEVHTIDELVEFAPRFSVVASPTHLHFEQVSCLVGLGIPVLVEKPLLAGASQLLSLNEHARKHKVPVCVGYHLRHHPALQDLIGHLGNQLVGRPTVSRSFWGEYLPDWHPGEDFRSSYAARLDQGGGPLATLSHTLDYCVRLFGQASDATSANFNLNLLGISAPEISTVNMVHETNCVTSIVMDYLTRPSQHHLEISLTDGSISLNFKKSELTVQDSSGAVVLSSNYGDPTELRMSCFAKQIDQFISDLESGPFGMSDHDLYVATLISKLSYTNPSVIPHS